MGRSWKYFPAGWCYLPLAVLVMLLNLQSLRAEEPAEPGADAAEKMEFLRLDRAEDKTPLALQTAIVRYKPADGSADGPTVDLIGAVHVGDKEYYEGLNTEFQQYDVLLYELVAPKNTRVPKGGKGGSSGAVGALQNGLKNLLGLEHQLEIVDYTAKNFVHADMSPDEFTKKMEERGESFFKMFLRIMTQSMAQQAQGANPPSDLELIIALFDKDRAGKLKIIMAEQFSGMEAMMVSLGGPDGSTIITERNKVALEVLAAQLKQGRKKVGIFYGAGHLADMDTRLREEFKLIPTETRWLTAWNLQPKQKAGAKQKQK